MSDAPRSSAFRVHDDLRASFTIHRGMTRDMSFVLSPAYNKAISALGFILGGLSVKGVSFNMTSVSTDAPFTVIPENDEYLCIFLRESLLEPCSRALMGSRNVAVKRLGEELLKMHDDLTYETPETEIETKE